MKAFNDDWYKGGCLVLPPDDSASAQSCVEVMDFKTKPLSDLTCYSAVESGHLTSKKRIVEARWRYPNEKIFLEDWRHNTGRNIVTFHSYEPGYLALKSVLCAAANSIESGACKS
jgi:hypothetical protein